MKHNVVTSTNYSKLKLFTIEEVSYGTEEAFPLLTQLSWVQNWVQKTKKGELHSNKMLLTFKHLLTSIT